MRAQVVQIDMKRTGEQQDPEHRVEPRVREVDLDEQRFDARRHLGDLERVESARTIKLPSSAVGISPMADGSRRIRAFTGRARQSG
jgi:hypothetical protein